MKGRTLVAIPHDGSTLDLSQENTGKALEAIKDETLPVFGHYVIEETGGRVYVHWDPTRADPPPIGTILKTHWELSDGSDGSGGEWVARGRQVVARSGGWLWQGKGPAHKPGTGRPPKDIRAVFRRSFAERLGILESIADDPETATKDVIAALQVLGRYSGVAGETDDPKEETEVVTVVGLPDMEPEHIPAEPVDDD